jgi:hypothetical protein
MSIFLPDPTLFGSGLPGRLNELFYLLTILFGMFVVYVMAFVYPVVALADHILLCRRRRRYGDERVWVKDLLAEAGRPALRRTGLPGKHRCAKQKMTRRELLFHCGWPGPRPPRPPLVLASQQPQPRRRTRHARA